MSNLQIIQELCGICDMQNRIIRAQSDALAQLGAKRFALYLAFVMAFALGTGLLVDLFV